MLVLSRKVGQSIKIGSGITVVVNRISGNRVTLALQAPRNMKIVRGELKPFDEEMAEERVKRFSVRCFVGDEVADDEQAAEVSMSFAPRLAR